MCILPNKPRGVVLFLVSICCVAWACTAGGISWAQFEDDTSTSTSSLSQGSEPAASSLSSPSQEDSQPAVSGSSMPERKSGMVSMDFQDAPLATVLRVLSDQTGLNFIVGSDVAKKTVSIYLSNVKPQEAIDAVLKGNNLTFERIGPEGSNIYTVRETGSPEVPLETKTFALQYLSVVKEVIKYNIGEDILEGLGEDEGEAVDKSMIEQVEIEGADMIAQKLISPRGSIVTDQRSNSIIITDTADKLKLIEDVFRQLDVKTPQVMIEAEILETDSDLLKRFGLKWGSGTNGTMFRIAGAQRSTTLPFTTKQWRKGWANPSWSALDNTIPDLDGSALYGSGVDPQKGVLSFAEFQVMLEAIETHTTTKILARPKVMTLNRYPAIIEITAHTAIGDIEERRGEGTATTSTNRAERVKTGVSLLVVPRVNKDGYITMKILPKVVVPIASEYFTSADQLYVDPHKRSADTTVMVKDGETLIIGGLLSTEDTDTVRKVPVIGDIPLIGQAFKHKGRDKIDRDLVIFINPHIMKDVEPDIDVSSTPLLTKEETVETDRGLQSKMILREQNPENREEAITSTVQQYAKKI